MPLTERQAFAAMFRFLHDYWERNRRPEELGGLLGSMNTDLAGDGKPADPAVWTDWLNAIQAIRRDDA